MKIYCLVSDTTSSGTECQLFATEAGLLAHLRSIIVDDEASRAHHDDALTALLDKGGREEIHAAWELWSENLRDPLDTYDWGVHEVEVPGLEALICFAKFWKSGRGTPEMLDQLCKEALQLSGPENR